MPMPTYTSENLREALLMQQIIDLVEPEESTVQQLEFIEKAHGARVAYWEERMETPLELLTPAERQVLEEAEEQLLAAFQHQEQTLRQLKVNHNIEYQREHLEQKHQERPKPKAPNLPAPKRDDARGEER